MSKQFSQELKREVIKAVQENPEFTHDQIAFIHDVSGSTVSKWALEAGIGHARTHRLRKAAVGGRHDSTIARLKTQLERLEKQKAAEVIRFERKRNSVVVHGLSTKPFAAHVEDWARFLSENGAENLRQFIEANFEAKLHEKAKSAIA